MGVIIGISGKLNSGKNTFEKILREKLIEKTKEQVDTYAFADPIKRIAMIMYPQIQPEDVWGPSENRSKVIEGYVNPETGGPLIVRDVLTIIGKLGRKTNRNIWVNSTIAEITRNSLHNKNVLIADVRFIEELKAIEAFGGHVVRIIRPSVKNTSTDESEINLDDFTDFYMFVENNTLEDLNTSADLLLHKICEHNDVGNY